MQNLFGLLFFVLLILSIVSIFKPSIVGQTSKIKGFLYPFAGAFLSFALIGVFAPENVNITNNTLKVESVEKSEIISKKEVPNLGELMGRTWKPPFSSETIEKWGSPETLEGTNNQVWIAYFPKGDFTVLSQKGLSSQILDFVKEGKVTKENWSKELEIILPKTDN